MAKLGRLNARSVATLREPGRYADGGGLYLRITPGGAKAWVFRYTRAGQQREMGLGPSSGVTLAHAREKAAEFRKAVAAGKDPFALREPARVITFGAGPCSSLSLAE